MIVDEWGCWHDVEIGTNPGFLYQQNTMRDAIVAGVTLNIFNKHCDRVRMACIAQIVNVLQAVVLTEGKEMLRTPTWQVFHMYRHHQGAELLESYLEGSGMVGIGEAQVTDVHESVSIDEEGIITVTLNNLSLEEERELEILLTEKKPSSVEGFLLQGAMDAHNTFEEPENVTEKEFRQFKMTEKGISLTMPPCSVMLFRIKGAEK